MSARVSVRMAGAPDQRAGTALAVKTASTPEEISRLAAEAEQLQQIAHPGVVPYVGYHETGDGAELHTVYAGESLERWRGTPGQAAGLVAALATSLADLHESGVVHGRIDRSHVLRGPKGRPVLCGLSPPPAGAEPATDVAAVGRLLDELLLHEAETATRPGSLLAWRDLLRSRTARRALERVASHAADPLAARRPTARALADAILQAVPGAQLPSQDPARSTDAILQAVPGAQLPPDPETANSDPFQRAFIDQRDTGEEEIFVDRPWQDTGPAHVVMQVARGRALIGVLVLASIAALMAGRLVSNGSSASRPPHESPDAGPAPPGDGPPDCPGTSGEDGPTPADKSRATTWADTNGDGCVESVAVTADGVIQIGDQRWAVGGSGDKLTLGDWDCDGSATPALYRQATGDVFVFDTWAERGQPVRVEPVGQVRGGVRFGTSRPGCDVPVVELASGARHPVEVDP